MTALDQPARVERQCGFCARPWFGMVAYCPYCGRMPGPAITDSKPEVGLTSGETLASDTTLALPSGELPLQGPSPPPKEPSSPPLEGLAIPGEPRRTETDRPPPLRSGKSGMTPSYKSVIAGASALLLIVMAVLAFRADEEAPPQPPKVASDSASARPVPSGIAAPPPVPSANAAPPPSIPQGVAAVVPPAPSGRSLCSEANEAAGLCKSQ
jgi:hypothetical protein